MILHVLAFIAISPPYEKPERPSSVVFGASVPLILKATQINFSSDGSKAKPPLNRSNQSRSSVSHSTSPFLRLKQVTPLPSTAGTNTQVAEARGFPRDPIQSWCLKAVFLTGKQFF